MSHQTHTRFFQQLVRTLVVLLLISLFAPQIAQARTNTVTTTLRVPFRDTVFVSNPRRSEWITVSGVVNVVTQIVIPGGPCILTDPCKNLNVAVRSTFVNVRAVGLTTGQTYTLTGNSGFVTTTDLPGKLTLQLDYTLSGPAVSLQSLNLSMDMTTQGRATNITVQPNLISWWKAEGDAADAVGNNAGTMVGNVSFVAGKVGRAFHFDGASMVEVASTSSTSSLEPQTMTTMLWMRSPLTQTATYLLSKGAYACNSDSSYAFYTAGNLNFYISDGLANNFSPSPPATINLWDGNWHHLAGSYDGSTVRLFVDGIEQGSGNPAAIATLNYALPDNQVFRIGGYASSCNSFLFDGDIDEVQILGRALSATEIQTIYSAVR